VVLFAIAGIGISQGDVGADAPSGRYKIMNNGLPAGTVLDNKTRLIWQQAVPAQSYTWSDAMSYCTSNTPGLPGNGWRLPSLKELVTIVDFGQAIPGPVIDRTAFPNTPSLTFWTSSPKAGSPRTAWYVYFRDRLSSSLLPALQHRPVDSGDVGFARRVRCVR
jgi:hypothetical protein